MDMTLFFTIDILIVVDEKQYNEKTMKLIGF